MSEHALRRTIRRCTAVLTIPIVLAPIAYVQRLESDGVAHLTYDAIDELGMLLILAAIVYLVGSVALQLSETVSTENPQPVD